MPAAAELTGSVLRIARASIHDGQGIRTVVFLKGCPLSCLWCSTPESQALVPERGYNRIQCTGCGACLGACPNRALTRLPSGGVRVDETRCAVCFQCVNVCPEQALKPYGYTATVSAVMREICRDEIFFFHSGGGVTISGGEALCQPEFVTEILRQCRWQGIPTALETSLYVAWEKLEKILPWLNILYVDIKHMDRDAHLACTGVDPAVIFENIKRVDQGKWPVDLRVRVPVIPTINDSDENLTATAEFCQRLTKINELELLAFHRLGTQTYANLGREQRLAAIPSYPSEWYAAKRDFLARKQFGFPVTLNGQRSAGQQADL